MFAKEGKGMFKPTTCIFKEIPIFVKLNVPANKRIASRHPDEIKKILIEINLLGFFYAIYFNLWFLIINP